MSQEPQSDQCAGRVAVGPLRPEGDHAEDVLPAVVKSRSDGTTRYICYSDDVSADEVASYRLSVDVDAVVAPELWR